MSSDEQKPPVSGDEFLRQTNELVRRAHEVQVGADHALAELDRQDAHSDDRVFAQSQKKVLTAVQQFLDPQPVQGAESVSTPVGWPCRVCGSSDTVCLQFTTDSIQPFCLCMSCGKAWNCGGPPPQGLRPEPPQSRASR